MQIKHSKKLINKYIHLIKIFHILKNYPIMYNNFKKN
jgi:hypothetical protein